MQLAPEILKQVNLLIDDYRDRCLWFLQPAYYPATHDEALRVMSQIERHADVAGFVRAREIRECLLQNSSVASVG